MRAHARACARIAALAGSSRRWAVGAAAKTAPALLSATAMKNKRLLVVALIGMYEASCGNGREVDSVVTVTSALCPDATFPSAGANGLWVDGRIPVKFEPGLIGTNAETLVRQGMNEWSAASGGALTFPDAVSSDIRYALFQDVAGCGTMRNYAPAPFAAAGCGGIEQVRHELGHLIAFEHGQQRSDRERNLVLMDASLFCPGGADVYTQVAPNSPYPLAGTGPGSTFGRFDFASIMLYSSVAPFHPIPCPFNCLLPTVGGPLPPPECGAPPGVGGGDWTRSFVKRGISTAGAPPCAADVPGAAVISPHDGAAAAEAYSTEKLWSPAQSMGTDVGSNQPLAFQLDPGVYAIGNPGLANLGVFRQGVTRGSDGNVYLGFLFGAAWTNLGKPAGTSLIGDPAIVSWSQSTVRTDVAIVAQDGAGTKRVYKIASNNGVWEPAWVETPASPPAGLVGGVAIASWGANRLRFSSSTRPRTSGIKRGMALHGAPGSTQVDSAQCPAGRPARPQPFRGGSTG